MKRRTPPVLILALLALALGGCGSGSSTSSGGSTSSSDVTAAEGGALTRAEFIAKADAFCKATKAQEEPLRTQVEESAQKAQEEEQSKSTVSDGTRKELAAALRQIGEIGEAGLTQLQGLRPPEAGASQLQAIFQKIESALAATHAYAAALESHEDAKAQAVLERGNAETSEIASLAQQYGFKVCGAAP